MNVRDKFSKGEQRVHVDHPQMSEQLSDYLLQSLPNNKQVVIACVGTDRSTGDSLGPLIGSMLQDRPLKTFHVYGTLEEPLHALNLKETIKAIHRTHPQPFILAIDACLGKNSSIGSVSIAQGTLNPGAALKKDLPPIGDMHISGMVNVGGFMEYVVLQNTRLHHVMKMAAKIAAGIRLAEKKRTYVYQPYSAATKKQQR
ncbi:spore protease YyaC [Halobacillus amylolyticus]|uniref:Spore protease YyaC n=1 Tax=Halobacillus amylolyticus TaxID=2932259 RepID=A0ABY4H843_9BACI|nr:spore protease YyaC [Halobacillus amylolyticus]UOR10774.1 spore protease YyaC [Halobacillus amylolyticus]